MQTKDNYTFVIIVCIVIGRYIYVNINTNVANVYFADTHAYISMLCIRHAYTYALYTLCRCSKVYIICTTRIKFY